MAPLLTDALILAGHESARRHTGLSATQAATLRCGSPSFKSFARRWLCRRPALVARQALDLRGVLLLNGRILLARRSAANGSLLGGRTVLVTRITGNSCTGILRTRCRWIAGLCEHRICDRDQRACTCAHNNLFHGCRPQFLSLPKTSAGLRRSWVRQIWRASRETAPLPAPFLRSEER